MENHERVERELLEQCGQVATLVECFTWLQRCDEQLEELCRAKRPHFAFGHRQSAVARIARLAGAKSQLERRFVHIVGEYASGEYASGEYVSSNERSLIWREIDVAFENRILTGAVINSNHIKLQRFLEDASSVVLQRVQDAVERYDSVKVNTAFNGEFAMKEVTKNSEIYRYTDLREWYEQYVIQPILVSLEEFQERDSGWALLRKSNLTVNVNKLNSLRAGSHIEVPRKIVTKRAIISVRTMRVSRGRRSVPS